MDAIRRRKIAIKILACVLALVVLVGAALCVWVVMDARVYTEEQHLYRIRKRAERRFLGEGSEFTGLEVYPLYDENEEFHYALIEFEPQGHLYVYISWGESPWNSMYGLSERDPMAPTAIWYPYVNETGTVDGVPDFESGEYVGYRVSPYKAANIQNERRYLIHLIDDTIVGHPRKVGKIPAVKRGKNYIDLVSGREIPCSTDFADETLHPKFETIYPNPVFSWDTELW